MPIAPDVYKKIVTAKLYIDSNFTQPIDLDRLSREACLSRFHFHRLFTRIYRVTPHQYLTRKRIEQARECLAGNTLTITEICNEVGFESIGSFSTLFKKEIGRAPTHYRVQAWQRQEQTRDQPRSFIPHCFIENCAGGTNDRPSGPELRPCHRQELAHRLVPAFVGSGKSNNQEASPGELP